MFGPDGRIQRGLGASLASQRRISEAIESFTAAVELASEDVGCRQDPTRILISTGDYPNALRHIDAAIELAPLDQRSLAFRSLCWRLSGDERAALINDYGRSVKHSEVPVPDGYRDIRAFNRALGRALHWTIHRRAGQDPEHPFLSRGSVGFRFSGSWSCRPGHRGSTPIAFISRAGSARAITSRSATPSMTAGLTPGGSNSVRPASTSVTSSALKRSCNRKKGAWYRFPHTCSTERFPLFERGSHHVRLRCRAALSARATFD